MLRLGRAAGAALRCTGAQSRYYSDATKTITATLFPGDGIGPEIADAVKQVSIRAAVPGPLPCTPSLHGMEVWSYTILQAISDHRCPAHVFHAAGAPIEWDEQYVAKEVDPRTNSFVTRENLDSVLV